MVKAQRYVGTVLSVLAAAALGIALAGLYRSIKPPGAALVMQTHAEAVSFSTFGKWPSDNWPVDAFSGEFPSLYNYLSDYLASWLASALQLPPFHVQAFVYGPALAGAMLFVNFLFLWPALRSPARALTASAIISFGTDLAIGDAVYQFFGETSVQSMKARMHVPFVAMPLATGQSLGWFLFVPTLASVYQSCVRDSIGWSIAAGVCFALLFQSHTLTFLNVTTAACVFIYAYALLDPSRKPSHFAARAIVVPVLFVALASWAVLGKGGFSIQLFAVLWFALVAASVKSRRDLARLGAMGAAALVVAFHYLVHLVEYREALGILMSPRWGGGMARDTSVLLYFLPLWLATIGVVAVMPWRKDPRLLWALCILLATWMLSIGSRWGFENHPYRMAINLIFPLSILFAMFPFFEGFPLGVRVAWLAIMAGLFAPAVDRNIAVLQGRINESVLQRGYTPNYYQLVAPPAEQTLLLDAIAANVRGTGKLLIPPEHSYPEGALTTSLILGASPNPGFIPDYRYTAGTEMYEDRMRLFCFLFPGFPHHDSYTGRRLCHEPRDRSVDGHDKITTIDPALRADVLPLYGIEFFAYWFGKEKAAVTQMAHAYHFQPVHVAEGKGLFTLPSESPGRARFGKASYAGGQFSFPVTAPRADCWTFVLAGTNLAQRVNELMVNASTVKVRSVGENVISFSTRLEAGPSTIRLKWPVEDRYAGILPAPFYFATGLAAGDLKSKLASSIPLAEERCP